MISCLTFLPSVFVHVFETHSGFSLSVFFFFRVIFSSCLLAPTNWLFIPKRISALKVSLCSHCAAIRLLFLLFPRGTQDITPKKLYDDNKQSTEFLYTEKHRNEIKDREIILDRLYFLCPSVFRAWNRNESSATQNMISSYTLSRVHQTFTQKNYLTLKNNSSSFLLQRSLFFYDAMISCFASSFFFTKEHT